LDIGDKSETKFIHFLYVRTEISVDTYALNITLGQAVEGEGEMVM
jgi:hypothetical protein